MYQPELQPPADTDNAAYVVFHRRELLSLSAEGFAPLTAEHWQARRTTHTLYLGRVGEQPWFAAWLDEEQDQAAEVPRTDLRALVGQVDDGLFQWLGRARQLLTWQRDHRYCGRCGTQNQPHPRQRALLCPQCGLESYPRLSPCVITLIEDGDYCLLARGSRHPAGFYSCLAGFIEPGENVEQALAREVAEEVGVAVRNPRYFGSQPWPFPGQLMLGFHVDYAGGELRLDEEEISDARWWRYDQLPPHPPLASLSGQLIDHFVKQRQQK